MLTSSPVPELDDPSLRATFEALYETLGIQHTNVPFAATITPQTFALGAIPSNHGVTVESLPRLSIALDAGERTDSTLPQMRELDVVGMLGEGGMGRVLLGRQRSLDRDVAIKTVKPELLGTKQADALVAEGVITGMLEHPNIMPVHLLGVDNDGRPVLVMKRIVGVSWADLVEDDAHPFWSKLDTAPGDRLNAHLEILSNVANALAYAHSRNIVHRDVKPENVMIGEFGEAYLVDFGIATKIRGRGRPKGLVGTPVFMAPEMIDERLPLGPHTDVYLLGATLHFLLTGHGRHAGETLPEVLCAAFLSAPYTYDPSVPAELAELANHATAREIADRVPSASAFRRALSSYFKHRSARALSDAAEVRLRELEAITDPETRDPAVLAQLVTECRFGFLMALREWPEHEGAKAGIERCLTCIVRIEVAREGLGAAEAALAEIRTPSPELVERVEALRVRMRAKDSAEARLRAIEQDQDLTVAAKHRRWLAIAFLVLAVLISTAIHSHQLMTGHDSHASGDVLVSVGSVLVVIGCIVGYLGRKLFAPNSINRKLTLIFLMTIVFQFVHRVVAWRQGFDSRVVLPADMMIIGTTTFAVGTLVVRKWIPPSLVAIAGALLCIPFPWLTEFFYFIVMTTLLVSIGFGWEKEPTSPT